MGAERIDGRPSTDCGPARRREMLVSMRRWSLRACAFALFALAGLLPTVSCVGDDPESSATATPDASTSTTDGAPEASTTDTGGGGGDDAAAETSVDAGSLY